MLGRHLADEYLGGDAEATMQGTDHSDAQGALVVEDLRDAALAGEELLQILLAQALLLHPELDSVHGIGNAHWELLLFISLHEQRPQLQLLLLWRTGGGVH